MGKVHPLGYQEKSLEVRLKERLTELGWKPSAGQQNSNQTVVRNLSSEAIMTVHLRWHLEPKTVNLDKGADNSHLQRCPEIEQWAKDVYDWCAKRYGQKNIIGFQVHLDESSPHIHALIVPVGQRSKSGRECVMWSAKFGKSRYEYGHILSGNAYFTL